MSILIMVGVFVGCFLLSTTSLVMELGPGEVQLTTNTFANKTCSLIVFLPGVPGMLSIFVGFYVSILLILVTFTPGGVAIFVGRFTTFFTIGFVFTKLVLTI